MLVSLDFKKKARYHEEKLTGLEFLCVNNIEYYKKAVEPMNKDDVKLLMLDEIGDR